MVHNVPREADRVSRLVYRTFLSGSLDDRALSVAVDPAGDAYVTGSTTSSDFPVSGAFQTRLAGGSDAFVAKLDPNGMVVYTTYLGGLRDDVGTSIAVDSHGDAYVAGWTRSDDFPTTAGVLQSKPGTGTCYGAAGAESCSDAFVAEFNPSGSIVYSTYLAGNRDDQANSIAIDGNGDVYVAGWSQSPNFPLHNAAQTSLRSGKLGFACLQSLPSYPCPNAFVAKLSPGARSLVYSTFLGGSGDDEAMGVALDRQNSAYVTGFSQSADFPRVHALQRHIGGPCHIFRGGPYCSDAFIAKLSAAGNRLEYSTLLGGRGTDEGHGVAVDQHGNAYVVGFTTSPNFPSLHALQRSHSKGGCTLPYNIHSSCPDMFLTKLNARGTRLIYSSHFGGYSYDVANAVAVDGSGKAFVGGYEGSFNWPLIHQLQKHTGGGFDAAIVAVAPSGNKAYFSTWYGGEGDDFVNGAAIGPQGSVYVAGEIGTEQYKSSAPFRGQDAMVLKLDIGAVKSASLPCSPPPGRSTGGCK